MENITEENLEFKTKLVKLKNEDDKEDSMRRMAWFSLSGLVTYPALVILCDIFGLPNALAILGSLAETYFISVSGLISVYFGSNAYVKRHNRTNDD